MKQLLTVGFLMIGLTAWASAEGVGERPSAGRYQMFTNPHANRVYVLDTQSGRVFQLANYKDIGKEIMEEVPYVYGSSRLCTPSEFERNTDKCFSRNYEYLKSLVDLHREQAAVSSPTAPAKP